MSSKDNSRTPAHTEQDKNRKAGKDAESVELTVEELEDRIAPAKLA